MKKLLLVLMFVNVGISAVMLPFVSSAEACSGKTKVKKKTPAIPAN